MKTFDAVFFDAGNTLVYLNMPLVTSMLERHGLRATANEMDEAELRVRLDFDREDVIRTTTDSARFPVYLNAILRRVIPENAPTFEDAVADVLKYARWTNMWDQVAPEAPPLLTRLRKEGYRLGIITNAPGTATALLQKIGLTPLVDDIVESAVVGIEKPDPRIFLMAAQRLGVDPKRSLFIGDLYYVDVVGAEAAGFTGVLLDPADLQSHRSCRRVRSITEIEDVIGNRAAQ